MSDIAEKVKAIIVDNLGVDATEVVAEASFTNDLGADSLDTVELIMELEKEFDVQIPDDKAEAIESNTPSTARPASALVRPEDSATLEIKSFLFT